MNTKKNKQSEELLQKPQLSNFSKKGNAPYASFNSKGFPGKKDFTVHHQKK